MTTKRYPLPRRFNAALSEQAYEKLRLLNSRYGYGNNYLLMKILENFDSIIHQNAFESAIDAFQQEYGAPPPPGVSK